MGTKRPFPEDIRLSVSIQSCVLCSFICFTGGSYVFFGIFPELGSPVMATINFVLWQWTFCGVIFCYMVMNKTLRQGVIKFYLQLFGVNPYQEESMVSRHLSQKSRTFYFRLFGFNPYQQKISTGGTSYRLSLKARTVRLIGGSGHM
uniref:PrgI family protein n=1 Tax=Steinernema glaseri TaxID=37863 RepID=A0A1I7YER4_9BILA